MSADTFRLLSRMSLIHFSAIILLCVLIVYICLFIPYFRALFHRFRIFNYFSRTHPTRHAIENSFIAAGIVATEVPSPTKIVQYDFRIKPSKPIAIQNGSTMPVDTNSSSNAQLTTLDFSLDAPHPVSPSSTASSSSTSIRVVTWNIEFGYRLNALLEELRRLDADIICLQEVDCFRDVRQSIAVDCVGYLAKHLGMCAAWSPCHAYGQSGQSTGAVYGAWGCAILSKFDIADPQHLSFTHIDQYPRSAIGAIVKTPLGDMCMYSLHLEVCCGLSTRVEQLQLISRHWIKHFENRTETVMFCGDFNTIGHGLIRLSPFHCTDANRWAQMGRTEAQMLQQVLDQGQLLPELVDFADPFDKVRDVTMALSLPLPVPHLPPWMEAKLDWMLMRGARVLTRSNQAASEIGQSDHGWCMVNIVPILSNA